MTGTGKTHLMKAFFLIITIKTILDRNIRLDLKNEFIHRPGIWNEKTTISLVGLVIKIAVKRRQNIWIL